MKILSLILFLSWFCFTNGKGNYDFPSAPVIPLPKPIDVVVQPAGHDTGVEEHKADSDHDSAYKFQEVSHSNPIDGSEKIVNEEAKDKKENSQYNLVAMEKELIPGFKESSVAEDSKENNHDSYYKFAAYDREIPALYQRYYPAYYPAFPMLPPYANGGYGGYGGPLQNVYGGGLKGGYGGALQSGYGDGLQSVYGGGFQSGYGGGFPSGYGEGFPTGYGGALKSGYGVYGSPYNGLGNSLIGLGNSLVGLGNPLGGNYLDSKSYGGYPNGGLVGGLEISKSHGSPFIDKDNYLPSNSYGGYGDKKLLIPNDPFFPSLSPNSPQINIKYNPASQNMKKVIFDQSYGDQSYQ